MKAPGPILPREAAPGPVTVHAGSPDINVFVPPEALFPELEATDETLIALLATLSRDAVLFACAHLNAVVSGTGHPEHKPRQERAIGLICSVEDLKRINAFTVQHPGGTIPTVFFRGQLLELMRWAVRYCPVIPDDSAIFTDPAARSRLLQAALIASTVWSRRVFADRLRGAEDLDTARQRALGAFRRGLEESVIAPHLGVTLGRGWSLFTEHFPKRYPAFAEDFLAATGLTVEQYFTCVTGLMTYLPFDRPDGPAFDSRSVAGATAYREIFPTYLALESQTPEQLARSLWEDFDTRGYRAVRERPILTLANRRAVILDPAFYCERISVGPLFHLIANAKGGKPNEIFGAFGDAFEDYATGILQRMYPERPGLARRLTCNIQGKDRTGRDFEMDAVLNDVVEAVVMELKAAWLPDEAVLDDSFENWLRQIRAKYGTVPPSADGKRERPKGVAQLARHVRLILDGDCGAVQADFAEVNVIYPVLVVHDTRLNAPAYGTFLATEFTALLGAVPQGKRVAPLVLMTIDDLENLESSIDTFSMRQLLADYVAACPDGLRSLHNFMATAPAYADKLKPSAQLMKSSEELIRHAQRELFPKSPNFEPASS